MSFCSVSMIGSALRNRLRDATKKREPKSIPAARIPLLAGEPLRHTASAAVLDAAATIPQADVFAERHVVVSLARHAADIGQPADRPRSLVEDLYSQSLSPRSSLSQY